MYIFSRLANVRVIVLIIFVASSLISKAEDASGKYNDKKILAEVQDISNSGVIAAQEATLDGTELTKRVKIGDLYFIIDMVNNNASVTSPPDSVERYNMTEIDIPDRIEDNDKNYPVVAIGSSAFRSNRNLQKVKIPDSITLIGYSAFSSCYALNNVDFGKGVTYIDSWAFYQTNLAELNLPKPLTYIGEYAFAYNKQIKTIIIPDLVETIELNAFRECTGLKSIKYGKSVCNLGCVLFVYCSEFKSILVDEANPYYTSIDGILYSKDAKTVVSCPTGRRDRVYLSDSVTRIEDWAFGYCQALEEVVLPESIIEIGNYSFYYTKLKSMKFGSNLLTIGRKAFEGCQNLESISLGPNIHSIEDMAFKGCTSLKNIELTSECPLSLGYDCFWACDDVRNVICNCSEPPTLINSTFYYKMFRATLYVPLKDFYIYYTTYPWKEFAHFDILENVGVDAIPDSNGQSVHTVYTIDGKLVMTTDDPDLLDTLPSGLYIINGKKSLIK